MSKILDQYGNPIDTGILNEPQTSRVAMLQNEFIQSSLAGLTPARLSATLRDADHGNLIAQHRLFADMEERDGHLRAEVEKRRSALTVVDWGVVPPTNATAAEKASAEWVAEVLRDAVDPLEDLLLAAMDAVGHGFAAIELEWRREGRELLPAFNPRPQEWFTLDQSRTRICLRDHSAYGTALAPFGWVLHSAGKAKSGYGARLGLHRTLSWPFIYKTYALGDFAEYLETFGLPMIVGKYFAGASPDEKASLLRAVTALGHDARAIMPADMQLEIQKITGGGTDTPHLAMVAWAEKAVSKCILGQTLTTEQDGGSYSLGKVHADVRRDILRADARSLAATLTRDLVYPLIAINRGGIDSLRRCPQFRFDLAEVEALTDYADALPKLIGVGFRIDRQWAQEKLRIPEPENDKDLLRAAAPSDPAAPWPAAMKSAPLAALSAQLALPGSAGSASTAPTVAERLLDRLAPAADAQIAHMVDTLQSMLDAAGSLEELLAMVEAAWPALATDGLTAQLQDGLLAAELAGRFEVSRGD